MISSTLISMTTSLFQTINEVRDLNSTASALLEATDKWSLNIDNGHVNTVVFLDLKNRRLIGACVYSLAGSSSQFIPLCMV